MKFCDRHWQMAKDAIKERGLDRDLAVDGKEAAERALAGKDDPLMTLHWMIVNKSLEYLGIGLMGTDENGVDYCPQCEMTKACAGKCGEANCADGMTEGAANFLAKELAGSSVTSLPKTVDLFAAATGVEPLWEMEIYGTGIEYRADKRRAAETIARKYLRRAVPR